MTFARKMKRKKMPKAPTCPHCHKRLSYHEGKDVWLCEHCGYVKLWSGAE